MAFVFPALVAPRAPARCASAARTGARLAMQIERDGGSATADASKKSVMDPADSPDGPYCEIGAVRRVSHLRDFLEDLPVFANPASGREEVARHFVANDDLVFKQCVVNALKPRDMTMYMRAGAREQVYFQPQEVRAAIVSCGGLCPGINTVIREIVGCLQKEYGVDTVFGIPNGYRGFYNGSWKELNEETTRGIHKLGGSILGSSRGGHDTQKIVDALEVRGINMVFIIGGDGTIRGADKIQLEARRRRLKMSVVSIPKTIDNDIPVIDHSFGFNSAVEEAQRAIDAANVEACSYPNGLAIVKLMGRNSGFIAMEATLSSRDVDVCLIPEESFTLFGEVGLYNFVKERLNGKGYCVIVVAEGAGQDILACLNDTPGFDKSGNRTLSDIGLHMANEFKNAFKQDGIEVSLKYIDPTYMVRAIRANAYDNLYCTMLSHMAVHGAFAGFTAFTVGPVNGYNVYIPIEDVVNVKNMVDTNDRLWLRLVSTTGQPRFTPLDDQCEIL
ncbi:ATP-dependent 6-phosphofructokinase 7 [Porphyridium purpureum]|uniref:ATP-dependent 6-phosphofructokinase 7 n=1 Tax=Porphyridium purpureum TaxID=35688 RepID=A0A5J4YJC1_PORPP|nr:ATP-dependent 6-phosphofructokinase 7 [Porphyridium purpureum]|eukprot:POR3579..scf291_13